MTVETRPEMKLPEQLTVALKLLAESEGRLSLMEETLHRITGAVGVVREARRGRQEKVAAMKERLLSLRRQSSSSSLASEQGEPGSLAAMLGQVEVGMP